MAVDFDAMAEYYDAMYVDEEGYRAEAERVHEIAQKYGVCGRLLDIACGTGGQALYLSKYFDVTGVDLSEGMIEIARKKVPEAVFAAGDMRALDVEGPFDIAVNLYGSIGFVSGIEELFAACESAADCLRTGGLFLLTPWGTRESFQESLVSTSGEKGGLRFCRMEAVRRAGGEKAEVEMYHLVGKGTKITQRHSLQEVTLFSEEEYRAALKAAGLALKERLDEKEFRMGAFLCRRE